MDYHLVVLIHGLWGNKSHFDYINQEIENLHHRNDSERLIILRTQGNEGYKTLDGIDVCGLRVVQEIREQTDQLNKEGKVSKISVVGYSLGGLIARYALGILYHQNYFDSIEPVNFTTFCTPHCGVLTPGSNISVKIFNNLVPALLSSSGKQMFLKDSSGKQGPLLELMANQNSVFYKGLQSFKYRSLYANAINDKRTSWWTAGISRVDPFIKINETSKLTDLSFKYVDGFGPIVIDSDARFVISNKPVASVASEVATGSSFWERKWNWVIVLMNILFVAPIWVLWFIARGILESIKSKRRISSALKDHSSYFTSLAEFVEDTSYYDDYSDVVSQSDSIKNVENFVDQNIEKSLHDRVDNLMESVWDAMTSKDEIESARIAQYDIMVESDSSSVTDVDEKRHQSNDNVRTSINELSFYQSTENATNPILQHFTLDLSPAQLEIVRTLNDITWQKFPVLIRHTKSTHSAAIVRNYDEEELFEGKVVVKHWLDKVFQLE